MNTILTILYTANVLVIWSWCLYAMATQNYSDLAAALFVLIITIGLIYLEYQERNLK
mgnify:FL=1